VRKMLGKLIFASQTSTRVQSAVQSLMGGPRLETVRFRDGHLFDCFTSEKYWWLRDSYEPSERRELEACLKPDSILFDVGAHAGFWAVILASKCRHIYAFEPSPLNFDRLDRNIRQNQIANVTAVPAAASNQTAVLRCAENGSMSHLAEKGVEVKAIQLDDYAAGHDSPNVVKIDIEGHAGAALSGMRRTLSESKPVLFLELHSRDEVRECRAVLHNLGYKLVRLGSKTGFPYFCRAAVN
jgi:FkbM family methyltransferase